METYLLAKLRFKVSSKILAKRLSVVLPSITSNSHTSNIPGRSFFDNLHLIRNLIDYINCKEKPLFILSIDHFKAFDQIYHSYLFKVLEAFGINGKFLNAIKILYSNPKAQILVNGHLTDPFSIKSGVRQGCPLSLFYMSSV